MFYAACNIVGSENEETEEEAEGTTITKKQAKIVGTQQSKTTPSECTTKEQAMAKGVDTKQSKAALSGSGNSKKIQIKQTRSKSSINFQWSKYVIKSYLTTYRGVTC